MVLDRDILKIFFNPVLLPPSYLYLLWFLPFFYFFICDLFKPWDVEDVSETGVAKCLDESIGLF